MRRHRGYGQDDGSGMGPGAQPTDFNHPLVQKLNNLQIEVARLQAANQAKKAQLDMRESSLRRGTIPVNGPQDVLTNLRNVLPDYLVPGNLGDVNKVVWPFWFTNLTPTVPAFANNTQGQATASVTITQEAAFIITSFMKSIFSLDNNGFATYVDPAQPGAQGLTPGLAMTIQDAGSSRVFMSNPIDFDTVGDGIYPQELPTPLMFLPNSVIKTQLYNASATPYVPFVTFIGVRCRIEDAQRIMSLITG